MEILIFLYFHCETFHRFLYSIDLRMSIIFFFILSNFVLLILHKHQQARDSVNELPTGRRHSLTTARI